MKIPICQQLQLPDCHFGKSAEKSTLSNSKARFYATVT